MTATTSATPAKESERRTSGTTRIPELDGLRGLAILLVVVLHYFVKCAVVEPGTLGSRGLAALRLSWSGVDLFFVLSGFLIGGILLDHRNAENYFRVFYVRRACRIFPLYFGWLAIFAGLISLPSVLAAGAHHWLLGHPLPAWSYGTFTQNVVMAANADFGPNWMGVSWSLAIEEQFYLLLPLLVRFVPPRRLPWVLLGCVALAPVLRMTVWSGPAAYLMMPCRADALMLGVLCAWAMRQPHWHQRILDGKRWLYLALGVLLAGAAFLTRKGSVPSSPMMVSWGFTWLAFLYACVLLLAVTEGRGVISSIMRWAPLRQLGVVAFGVYLFHQAVHGLCHGLIFQQAPRISTSAEWFVSFAALALTWLLAWASWEFFEKRLVAVGHRWRYQRRAERASEAAVPDTATPPTVVAA